MTNFQLTNVIKSIADAVSNTDEVNIVGVEDRLETIAVLIGGIIGQWVNIPATKVTSPDVYYLSAVLPIVNSFLGEINEAYPIDIELAQQAAKLVWIERYKFVHSMSVSVGDTLNRVFLSMNKNGSEVDIERMNLITTITNGSQEKALTTLSRNLKTFLEAKVNE